MRSRSPVLVLTLLVFLAVGCASNVKFAVRDKTTGQPINNYSVTVDGKSYSSGETAQLNRAIWKSYSATVQADGYQPEEYRIKKEIIPEMLIGGIIIWPAWLWCYGPSEMQEFYLSQFQMQQQQEMPMIGANPSADPVK